MERAQRAKHVVVQGKGKGKGRQRLTGLANYEALKMQRQSSIGNTQVSSAPPTNLMDKNEATSPKSQPDSEEPAEVPVQSMAAMNVSHVPLPSPPLQLPTQNVPFMPAGMDPNHSPGYSSQPPPNSHVEFEQMQMMARLQAQHLSSQQPHTQNSSYYPGGNFSGEGFSNGGSEAAEWQQQAADDGTAQPEEHPVQQQEIEEDSRGKSKAQMKNQKKHQRQRERKAKELRNQCLQLVVDWKLNSLAAPLIAMGFPQDQCIDAVCACSDGKAAVDLERCVSWIVNQQSKGSAFSFGAEDPKHKDSRQPDIDITDEVQKMTEAEAKMGVTSADVERAVLAHNGDVNSACQSLVQGSNSSNGYTSTMVH